MEFFSQRAFFSKEEEEEEDKKDQEDDMSGGYGACCYSSGLRCGELMTSKATTSARSSSSPKMMSSSSLGPRDVSGVYGRASSSSSTRHRYSKRRTAPTRSDAVKEPFISASFDELDPEQHIFKSADDEEQACTIQS